MAEGFANQTPGQWLRQARESREISLEAAHEGTKIPIRLIEALERDEYHKMSGPLYVKSFLRNYAGWLGLDVEAVLRAYENLAGSTPAGEDDVTWSEENVRVTRVGASMRREVIIGVVAVVVVVAAGIVVWPLLSSDSGRETTESASTTASELVASPAETVAAAADSTRDLPVPWPASSDVPLQDGTPRELVLRVLLSAPTNCSVRADGQSTARPVVWPDAPQPLPDAGIEPGVAYAVRNGYAIYWGARDNFTLTLANLEGVTAMLNGVSLPVGRWQEGQPVVLDARTLQRADG